MLTPSAQGPSRQKPSNLVSSDSRRAFPGITSGLAVHTFGNDGAHASLLQRCQHHPRRFLRTPACIPGDRLALPFCACKQLVP